MNEIDQMIVNEMVDDITNMVMEDTYGLAIDILAENETDGEIIEKYS